MSTLKYNTLVFIGRFQPFHFGHYAVVNRALELAENVIILVGSSNVGRSMRNPFTFEERKSMIAAAYKNTTNLQIHPINDMPYNDDRWIEQVQRKVAELTEPGETIGLIGSAKDSTGFYLELFPTWGSVPTEFLSPINATDVRNAYWKDGVTAEMADLIPSTTAEFLEQFATTPLYESLRVEQEFINKYKDSVKKYDRIEHTVDAVVVQSGHILLIRRRSAPGKGMWALPGGFLNVNERLEDGAIRELREETGLKVPDPVLRGNIKASKTYDDPNRSARGRLITQAFYIALPRQKSLPKVKGMDDADKAAWVPLNQLVQADMFEDHFFIIDDMLGGI